jgi:hypothetical protein
MNYKMMMLGFIFGTMMLDAKYVSIKNEQQFFDEINSVEFVIACFLPKIEYDKNFDRAAKKDIQLLQDVVKSTAMSDPYKKMLRQEVAFLVVDLSKKSLDDLAAKYPINHQSMPQFLLFKDGKVVSTVSGQLAQLVGFIAKKDLIDFVDEFFGTKLDELVEKKEDDLEKKRELDIAKYQAYASYRYPYGGYAPYNAWGPYAYSGYTQFYPYGYGRYGFGFTHVYIP